MHNAYTASHKITCAHLTVLPKIIWYTGHPRGRANSR